MTGGAALVAAIIVAIVGAIGSFVGSWYLVRRQRSGRIATSEARDLWKESTSIRTELRERVAELEDELVELRKQNAEQASRIALLENENELLRRRLDAAASA